ncbi:porin family protein [Akkermansiaceae bacterium]|nr:porin family protein [Akkermansiaceae bacterium]MDB4259866.1 porin family protein [Akkermansiaceae bacterium]MDB4406808.1 porin family protein [Akkermansiaceae bacterium]MDB4570543.1 porin family protein [Akkermansiaceae bacterium]
MKKTLLTIASAALLSSTAQAQNIFGDDPSFFASPFVGYGFDSEENYGGIAVGIENGQTQFYLQYGGMSQSILGVDLGDLGFGLVDVDVDIDAISIGYTGTTPISDTTNLYLGVSMGLGSIEVSVEDSFNGGNLGNFDESVFYFDAKIGVEVALNDNVSLLAGVRYFYFAEPIEGVGALDDFALEVGAKFTF